jgi:hypothetical protein
MPWINSFLASTAVRRPGNLGRDKPFFSFLKKKWRRAKSKFGLGQTRGTKIDAPSFHRFGFSTG